MSRYWQIGFHGLRTALPGGTLDRMLHGFNAAFIKFMFVNVGNYMNSFTVTVLFTMLSTLAIAQAMREEVKKHYPDGKIQQEGLLVNHVKEGKWKYYFETGNLQKEESYRDGKPIGTSVEYEADGATIDRTIEHLGDGVTRRIVYSGGKKFQSIHLKAGEKEGPFEEYFDDGKIAGQGNFVNDEMDGEFRHYWQNGTFESIINYKAGVLHGLVERHYENGQLKFRQLFDNGKLHGSSEGYWESGKPSSKGAYHYGQKDGPWISYYPNGKKEQGGIYKIGRRDGVWVYYTNDSPLDTIIYNDERVIYTTERFKSLRR
jgi:antitoxin component YwqK of YwqJK toxin-antitoxin module